MAAMLSEPYETLKRRIKIMTMPLPKKPWIRGGLLAGVGALLVALACWAPGPTDGKDESTESPGAVAASGDVGADQESAAYPVFTPYTVKPDVRNVEEVLRALERDYPPSLRDAGIGGTVTVWFFVDQEGRVQNVQVNASSGHKALDDAAIRVASIIEFSPALNRDKRMPVWISLPIEFITGDREEAEVSRVVSTVEGGGEDVTRESTDNPGLGSGQTGEISGTTTDIATGEGIPFVQLFVSGTGRGTLSNQDGRFLIQHVPVGDQQVIALIIGYGQIRKEVTVTAEERAKVDLNLQVTAIGLSKLVVRGVRGTGGRYTP
jgi:TonB family protein